MTAPQEIISLARRWAWWSVTRCQAARDGECFASACPGRSVPGWERSACSLHDLPEDGCDASEQLTARESDALYGWVRMFMQRKHGEYVAARLRFGSGLGLTATRDPVSRDVALALGFTKDPFAPQHGTAVWRLCEAAGWP